jgi:hypothetical protein
VLAPTRPVILPDGFAYCDAVRTHQHQGMTKHHSERRILSDVGLKGLERGSQAVRLRSSSTGFDCLGSRGA